MKRSFLLALLLAVIVLSVATAALAAGPKEPGAEPAGYTAIIDSYREFLRLNEKAKAEDDWGALVEAALEGFWAKIGGLVDLDEDKEYELSSSCAEIDANLGYAIHDLNGDRVPELIILSGGYTIHALYTLSGEKPVLLGAYWSRNSCVIDETGTLYISGSGGASDSSSASYTIAPCGAELQLIEMVGVESYDDKTGEEFPEGRYYRIQNGTKTVITEEEAGAAWRKFPSDYPDYPTKSSGIVFNPIAPDVISTVAEKYVLLTIAGEKVNLRTQPQAAGKALKQCNTGDRFLAEPDAVTNSADGSTWYKIVAAVHGDKPHKYAAYVSARYTNASAIPSGLLNDHSFLFTRLFNDFFLVYARREKPIVWNDVQDALTAAGYEVIEESGTFSVDDPDNKEYWLGGLLTTDGEAVGGDKHSSGAWLADIGYCTGFGLEKKGVEVAFRNNGDRYFINMKAVGNLDDLIDYFK